MTASFHIPSEKLYKQSVLWTAVIGKKSRIRAVKSLVYMRHIFNSSRETD